MTLTDLLPSLRTSLPARLDAEVWPSTARWGAQGDLLVGGVRMSALGRTHGTPAHVLDEHDVRARCDEYVRAFGAGTVAYSAKAGLTVEAGRWIAGIGLGCYVSCAAQLRTALLAGFPPERLVLHGSAKSVMDLDAAYACGAAIVAGSIAELERVAARAPQGQRVLLRVVPAPGARARIRYGLRLGAGPALTAIETIAASPNVVLAGLDCSLGHQLIRFQVFEACLREAMAFAAVVRARCLVVVPALNLGGDGGGCHGLRRVLAVRRQACGAADRPVVAGGNATRERGGIARTIPHRAGLHHATACRPHRRRSAGGSRHGRLPPRR
ncbi:hypothetical protein ACFQFC_02115 [Amorphoplanes digitatis]|uniref:Diaminopimelate decarboxylase n=1 Tax=Actinoplanes digitatis TaxID=1868 RepID=A0A7W7HY78_9ACTN|nr:hypothetical protein [Actinoplanes digitatis]MBB4762972.1 diaminopimelate decarboxylase [Actinoplanes digitatis]GID95826.1 hypothetical protein Adi01nite_52380 [Actinoplanes digitatis]